MEAIDFIKKYHKQYIGNINKDIVDEEGFNYYYYYIKYCCIEYNEIKDTYLLNITEDVYNIVCNEMKRKIHIPNFDKPVKYLLIVQYHISNHYYDNKNITLIFDTNDKVKNNLFYNNLIKIKTTKGFFEDDINLIYNNQFNNYWPNTINIVLNTTLPKLQYIICHDLYVNAIQPFITFINANGKVILNQTLLNLNNLESDNIYINAIQPSLLYIKSKDNKLFKYLNDFLIKLPKLKRIDNDNEASYIINKTDFIDIYDVNNLCDNLLSNIINYAYFHINKYMPYKKVNYYCIPTFYNINFNNLNYLRINKNNIINNEYFKQFINNTGIFNKNDYNKFFCSFKLTNIKILELNVYRRIYFKDNNTQQIIINKNNFNNDELKQTIFKFKINNKSKSINLFDLIIKKSNNIKCKEFNKLYKLVEDDNKYLFIKN